MNEQELRAGLRGVMTAPAPPPMNATAVLDAARRAHRRRRATLAGLASAGAVVVITAGGIAVSSLVRDGNGHVQVAGGGPGVQLTTPPPDTRTSWPDGQTDRTATSGPRADQGTRLQEQLAESVPAALRAPTDLKPGAGAQRYGPLWNHQAQYAGEGAGKQVWEYMAEIPFGANGKWGRLLAEVHTVGNGLPGDACELTKQFWGMDGQCQLITVGDKQIGVAIRPTKDDRFDQWAGYRHPDGTVVFVAQAKTYPDTDLPGLNQLPFTAEQLAALATDPKFRMD